MPRTPAQKIFALAGKAVLKAYNHGVHNLTSHEIDEIGAARTKLLEFIHVLTGPRPGQLKDIMHDAILHVHPGKDYDEIAMAVKDLADICVTFSRLSQRLNRTSPDKISEAKMFCDHLKHG